MSGVFRNVDVLLLAAGFGTRLLPLTEKTPKPLIEVAGRPLIDWNLQLLADAGAERVIINLHYLPDEIRNFVGSGMRWGLAVEFVYEPTILETGGAIKNIETLLEGELLLTLNSDILLGDDFSLTKLVAAHQAHEAQPAVTMVLREDEDAQQYGALGIDEHGRICSFLGNDYVENPIVETLMYTGVQVMARKLLDKMPSAGSVFSVTQDFYPGLFAEGEYFNSFVYNGYWNDVGTHERLAQARRER